MFAALESMNHDPVFSHPITDADLFDFVEGRAAPALREEIARRLPQDAGLRAKCARLGDQIAGLRAIRRALPTEPVPEHWLHLATQLAARR